MATYFQQHLCNFKVTIWAGIMKRYQTTIKKANKKKNKLFYKDKTPNAGQQGQPVSKIM